ncbi:hypothetical protein HBB16_12750 [Pseudonocardia sp. MCCB 268]|nr:hypothetical protein [Pseudonocardia cytotoxica]
MTTAPLFLVDDVATLPAPGGENAAGRRRAARAPDRAPAPGRRALVLSDGRGGLAHAGRSPSPAGTRCRSG